MRKRENIEYNFNKGGLCPFERWLLGENPLQSLSNEIAAAAHELNAQIGPIRPVSREEIYSGLKDIDDHMVAINNTYLTGSVAVFGGLGWSAFQLLERGVPVLGDHIEFWTCVFLWSVWLGGASFGLILSWVWTCILEEDCLKQRLYLLMLDSELGPQEPRVKFLRLFKSHPLQRHRIERWLPTTFKIFFLLAIGGSSLKLMFAFQRVEFPLGIAVRESKHSVLRDTRNKSQMDTTVIAPRN